MNSEGVELQHRGKPADVSYQTYDGSSEGQLSGTANDTESSKVHTRQLDVCEARFLSCRCSTDDVPEIHQLFTHCCIQYEHAMLMGSFGSIFYCWLVERRTSM